MPKLSTLYAGWKEVSTVGGGFDQVHGGPDQKFGISILMEGEFWQTWGLNSAQELTVEHAIDFFQAGSLVLTLKGFSVLQEEEDVLVNTSLGDRSGQRTWSCGISSLSALCRE